VRTQILPDPNVLAYGLMIFGELLLGLSVGFTVLITLDTLKFAGELMGMQIGFSFVQVVDPESSRSQAVLAEFFQVLGVLLFLLINGHLIIIKAFSQSYDLIPAGGLRVPLDIVSEFVRVTGSIFWVGLQISMPIIAIVLIGDIALGIIARTVPRMNIFQVGFPIKICLGFLVLALVLPILADAAKSLLESCYGRVNTLMLLFGRG